MNNLIEKVVTLKRASVDKLIAASLVQMLSWKVVKVLFVPGGTKCSFSKDTMVLGIGGGDFDPQSFTVKGVRPQDECVSTLVAYFFGKKDNPCFTDLLKAVLEDDLAGESSRVEKLLGLREPIKTMYANDKSDTDVLKIVNAALAKFLREQKMIAASKLRKLEFEKRRQQEQQIKKPTVAVKPEAKAEPVLKAEKAIRTSKTVKPKVPLKLVKAKSVKKVKKTEPKKVLAAVS